MKSIFLKAVKVGALSLMVAIGASEIVLANGAGAPPTTAVALNGGGNGAGGTVKRKTRGRRISKRGRRGRRTA